MTNFLISILFLLNINEANHPIHLSVTNIEFNEKTKNFDIKVRFFVDDFETAVNKQNKIILNLNTDKEIKNADSYIIKYCKEKLNIALDGIDFTKKMILEKREINNEEKVIWLDFSIKANIPKKIKITNKLMTEMFSDQKNLLIFTCKKKQEAFTFDNSNITKEIVIN